MHFLATARKTRLSTAAKSFLNNSLPNVSALKANVNFSYFQEFRLRQTIETFLQGERHFLQLRPPFKAIPHQFAITKAGVFSLWESRKSLVIVIKAPFTHF